MDGYPYGHWKIQSLKTITTIRQLKKLFEHEQMYTYVEGKMKSLSFYLQRLGSRRTKPKLIKSVVLNETMMNECIYRISIYSPENLAMAFWKIKTYQSQRRICKTTTEGLCFIIQFDPVITNKE